MRVRRILVRGIAVLAALFAVYVVAVRPWSRHWGAADSELRRTWPGDELLEPGTRGSTRAITIEAPPEAVWPWVAQIGQDRGGFYSYTWLENLFGAEITNAERIVPEWQVYRPGDALWLGPKQKFGGNARLAVVRFEPGRVMVVAAPPDAERVARGEKVRDFLWTFIVEPDGGRTRLVVRSASGEAPDYLTRALGLFVWEPVHFVMERGMLYGIKERAERGTEKHLS